MFKMSFEFKNRDIEDLRHVNAALASMRLSSLKMDGSDGYLATITTRDPKTQQVTDITYGYGFDQLTLACETVEREGLHAWQIDTQAFPKGEVSGSDKFHDMWCAEHTDRVMRVLMTHEFDDEYAFVVLHHEKA